MTIFSNLAKKVKASRTFFFSTKTYLVYAQTVSTLQISIEFSFSEKKSVSQISSKVCKKTFKGKNRATALHVIPDDCDFIPLSDYLPPIEDMKGTIVGNDYQKPLDFGFLKRAFHYLDERDLLNIVLHECFQKILFFQSKNTLLFSKFLITCGPIVGIYLSTGFFSSSLSTFFELVIPNSSLLATPVILAWKRILSVFSLSFHLYSLYSYLPLVGSLPGEKSIGEISRLLILAGTATSLGTYADALSLEANSAHIKIKLVSQLANELITIVHNNWISASIRFQVPLFMANQVLGYNQKFLFKQVSLNNYYLDFVVNQIQTIANVRNTYSIQNPLSLVSIQEFPTVSVTLLKFVNGKQLLIGGTASNMINAVLSLNPSCGMAISLFKK